MTYNPGGSTRWQIEIAVSPASPGRNSRLARATKSIGIEADVWADPDPGASIDIGQGFDRCPFADRPGRWRTVRQVWTSMAETDTSVPTGVPAKRDPKRDIPAEVVAPMAATLVFH